MSQQCRDASSAPRCLRIGLVPAVPVMRRTLNIMKYLTRVISVRICLPPHPTPRSKNSTNPTGTQQVTLFLRPRAGPGRGKASQCSPACRRHNRPEIQAESGGVAEFISEPLFWAMLAFYSYASNDESRFLNAPSQKRGLQVRTGREIRAKVNRPRLPVSAVLCNQTPIRISTFDFPAGNRWRNSWNLVFK